MTDLSLPPNGEVFVPDGTDIATALSRTTHAAVVAHPDDAEIIGLPGVGACVGKGDTWFTAVVCTDGAGSVRNGPIAGLSAEEVVSIRRAEQRRAAEVGGYSAAVQIGRSSLAVRAERAGLAEDLRQVLAAVRPEVLFTHNPADKHPTHVAVATAVVEVVGTMDPDERPGSVYGVEGWGDLDWLADDEKVRFDVSAHADLARELMACFGSQIAGGKRYDLALEGRRRANATLFDPYSPDAATDVVVAMDLGPVVDGGIDLGTFLERKIRDFRRQVIGRI